MCIITSTGCTTTPPPPAPEKAPFELSDKDLQLSEAFAHFTAARILEANPDATDKAIDEYLLAAEADPTRHMIYTTAAQAAIRDLDVPHAVEILQKNVAANPDSAEAYMELGAVLQLAGDRAEAATQYQKAMELGPSSLSPYLYLAGLYFGQEEDAKALAVLTQGIKHVPAKAVLGAYCYRVGKEMLDARQFARAIPCLELVADTMEEGGGLVHQLIGEIYESMKDIPNAMVHYQSAAESTPPVTDAVVKIALSHMPTAPDKAISVLQAALKRSENDDELLFALALIHREANNLPESLATFELLRSTHQTTNAPLTEGFYLNYANTCVMAGITNKAESILLECITLHPDSHQSMNFLAYTWAEQGVKLDKALSYVKQALAAEPKNGAYLDTLGWIYFKQGIFDKAIEALLQSNAIMEDAVISDHLGDVFLAMGEEERAIEYWKRSLVLDPDAVTVQQKLQARGVTPDPVTPVTPAVAETPNPIKP